MEKSKYESEELATAYLKTHNLQYDAVKDENGSFYGFQRPQSDFDTDSFMTVKMAEGVHVIAGPLKPTVDDSPFVWASQSLDNEQIEKLAELDSKESEMEHAGAKYESLEACVIDHKGKGLSDEDAKAACAKLFEKEEAENAPEPTKEEDSNAYHEEASNMDHEATKDADSLQEFSDNLAEKTAQGVAAALTPMFSNVADTLKSVSTGLELLANREDEQKQVKKEDEKYAHKEDDKKMGHEDKKAAHEDEKAAHEDEEEKKKGNVDEKAKGKKEVGKSADKLDQVFDVLNDLAANLKQTQDQVVEVAKTADALSKVTPSDTLREERLSVEKSAESRDPNAIFDSTFPFIGGYDV